ncbi:MAG TPA: UbiA family prenyltransferase [Bryobacteraceae bacterium]|nr:UbiA family prenyltransferase [Bryobacteraceae bacterium]
MTTQTLGKTAAGLQGFLREFRGGISCTRWEEVALLQGMPLLGSLFAMGQPSLARLESAAILAAGSTLITAHVFVLNDWSGLDYDKSDPNRNREVFTARGIAPRAMAFLAAILLLAGLWVISRFGLPSLALALGIAAASALYSSPASHGKGIPVVSSLLHFCGGLLQFLLGYSVFARPGWRGVGIGIYFALVFMGGHLTHETRDSESDGNSRIRTNAVAFGKRRCFLAGLFLFACADGALAVLIAAGAVPRLLAPLLLLFPLHAYWSIRAMRADLNFVSVQRLQWQYRGLYAVKGLWMAAVLLFLS